MRLNSQEMSYSASHCLVNHVARVEGKLICWHILVQNTHILLNIYLASSLLQQDFPHFPPMSSASSLLVPQSSSTPPLLISQPAFKNRNKNISRHALLLQALNTIKPSYLHPDSPYRISQGRDTNARSITSSSSSCTATFVRLKKRH